MEISIKWTMCRTCTTERGSALQPLFESEAAKHLNLHAGLAVKQDDGLPDQICEDCVDKLEQVHRFIRMCRRSDAHLKNLVSKTFSSAEHFKTFQVADESPPPGGQRKRARKQELSAQTLKDFPDDETAEEPQKKEEEEGEDENFVEVAEADEKSYWIEEESGLVFDKEYIIPISDENYLEATSSQGSPLAIHNGAYSQEASEEESVAQKSDTASEDQHKARHNSNSSQTKSYSRKHLNEKSYECEVCSRRFNAACNLTSHMRTHTGEKPFKCSYCLRRFADHSSHRKHERIHTNERPYACNICGKTFALSTSRKAHYMTHSSEKPYKCQPCMKSFRLKHQLTAHEKTEAHRQGCAS
ncbi:hypothetical protein KR032_007702 [Drosophila birchii]|nr:hypothetical protein KR032_007702 [Drosophila birchii]